MSRRDRVDDHRRIGDVATELAALMALSVGQLRERFGELYGFGCGTRNKDYLRKRLAWRIQELAEGGLSEAARARIDELAPPGAPIVLPGTRQRQVAEGAKLLARLARGELKPRDPRLPRTGMVIERSHAGVTHQVTIGDDDFEYQGERYSSLSQVARAITGTPWNGFVFFGLGKREERS
jgi:hypothetical protein